MKDLEAQLKYYEHRFLSLSSWEDRYKLLIEIGKAHVGLPAELQTPEALVKGCQSQVWLHAKEDSMGRLVFSGDSDALLVKGLVALVVDIYSGLTPEQVLALSPQFLAQWGFQANLSPSRANGLNSMVKQIKFFAFAFQVKNSN